MAQVREPRVRKDTGETVGKNGNGAHKLNASATSAVNTTEVSATQTNGTNGKKPGKAGKKEGTVKHPDEFIEDGKMLLPVNRDRAYRIVVPDKPKDLDPKFDIPDTSLGRAARNYGLLCKAEDEIATDRKNAHLRLLTELKSARKTDFKVQIGRSLAEFAVNHTDPKEEVKVKWV